MIATLAAVLSATCDKDLAVVCLDWTEANRDIKVNVEQFARLLVYINQVVMDRPLVKLEIVNAIRCLADTLAIVAETWPTVNLWDCSLHQMTLIAHEFISRAICHRLYSCTKSASRRRWVPTLLHIIVPIVVITLLSEVIIHIVLIPTTSCSSSHISL